MVFHITNYMRETNTWMIRKGRWILWGTFGFVPIYRNVYWDYLGRRVAWKDSLSGKTEDEKRAIAESERADWGYHPRYEGKYPFSIKTRSQALMNREETLRDTPRIRLHELKGEEQGLLKQKEVQNFIMITREHNRQPGAFDYKYPQTFYSTFPEVDQETYVSIGSDQKRRVHNDVAEL